MINQLIVEPMRYDVLLWRCLHGGPINADNLENPERNGAVDWDFCRVRNIPILRKLIRTYGTCAMLARIGDSVVGTLRFYPLWLCPTDAEGAGFCLQQCYPAGPREAVASGAWPSLQELERKTLFVHCMMVAAIDGDQNRIRRRGIGSEMVRGLIRWATEQGWQSIEADAYEEIPMLYAMSGTAGRRFWRRLGFRVVGRDTEPALRGDLLRAVQKSAIDAGVPAERAADRFRMRFELR